jgi:hypothetical protein
MTQWVVVTGCANGAMGGADSVSISGAASPARPSLNKTPHLMNQVG